MSKTTKRKAKTLKCSQKIQIPAQSVTIRMIKEFEGPSLEDKILCLKVSGDKGALKGQVWDMIVFGEEDVNILLKNPPLRRFFSWLKNKMWG